MNTQVQVHHDVQSIPLDQLHVSPLNVRKTGGTRIDSLAASIRARGLIHHLTVVARPRESRRPGYEVVAGRRRLAALRLLARRKELATNVPVGCRVVPREQATATSLTENVEREAMHPADQFAAFAKLVDEGQSAEDIAAQFGVGVDTVHKRLRLAKVSPRVMQCYRAGDLHLEQVMAFTLSDDHAAQDALLEGDARLSAWDIRRRLTASAVRGDDPRARLVGRKAYVEAGGSIRRDLFGNDATEYFEDAALLDRLASEKLERAAAPLRKRLPWVQTVVGTLDYAERSRYGRVPRVRNAPDARTARKLQKLQSRLTDAREQVAALEEEGGDGDEADRVWQQANERVEAIEDRIAAIEHELVVPDPAVAPLAGAVVALDHRGRIDILDGLIRPEDRREAKQAVAGSRTHADDDGNGGQDTLRDPRTLRRDLSAYLTAVAQHALAQDVPLALRALAFQMVLALRGERGDGHGLGIAVDDHADVGPAAALGGEDAHAARLQWHTVWERTLPVGSDALWTWCREADDHMILSLLAYCAARSFTAVLDRDETQPALPLLSAMQLDMRVHWCPDAAYFSRLRKADTLAILAAHGHAGHVFAKLKRDVLAETAAKLLSGSGWLPPTLSIAAV